MVPRTRIELVHPWFVAMDPVRRTGHMEGWIVVKQSVDLLDSVSALGALIQSRTGFS